MINKKLVKKIYFILIAIIIISLIILLWPVLVPFFFALLFAYLLMPAVKFLIAKKIPSTIAIIIVYLLILGLGYIIIFFALPLFSEQLAKLVNYLPQLWQIANTTWFSLENYIQSLNLPQTIIDSFYNLLQQGDSFAKSFIENTALSLVNGARYLIYLLLAPVLSYYIMRDKTLIQKKIISFLSPKERPEILRIAGDVNYLLRQFLYGYLLVSVIIAVLTGLFLWLIGVEYALLLGILMGIADLIPYFGPVLASIPIIFIAYIQEPILGLYAAIGLIILQQVEGNIITPKIVGNRIGLHPLLTIFVVMAGGYFLGIIGTILAVPLMAAFLLIFKYIYSRLVAYIG